MSKAKISKDGVAMEQQGSTDGALPGRRRVLEMLGMTAVALPVLGLQACGGDDSASAPAKAMEKAAPAMSDAKAKAEDMADAMSDKAGEMTDKAEAMMDDASEAMSDGMDAAAEKVDAAQEAASKGATIATDAMAQLDENGPQASGLGYRHDATTVENGRYKAGQQCSNCVLFQGGDQAWGGCPLFTGKQVKATGWCSAYSAAS